jgi:hypothetical protein
MLRPKAGGWYNSRRWRFPESVSKLFTTINRTGFSRIGITLG